MVVDELFDAFKEHYPQYTRIFAETLPPGKLAEQLEGGSLTIGNMRISLKPDIYTAGSGKIEELKDKFDLTAPYTTNRLAIMVSKGNPMGISGLKDLSSPTLNISMPNPQWEGIGKQIEKAYIKAGGEELRSKIMETKVDDGSTYLTQIHHRQTPMRILYGESEAGPVWYTEVFYQQLLGHPISMVEIPENENVHVTYVAGKLKNAPHKQAASDFMDFLTSPVAKAIYKKYGFGEVQ
jgi:ABC-type molybdate transport system substrate-binding protein